MDAQPAETPSRPPLRIVVAEDEAIIRMDIAEMLVEEGYAVVEQVSNGAEAIEAVARHQPDVAILDIKMPVLDGISAAKVIVDEHGCGVVLLTAFSQRELIEEAREAGAYSYVVKPFERSDLVPAVEMAAARAIDSRRLRDEVSELRGQLAARKTIERAKGLLADRHGLGEDDAFAFLRRTAMNERSTMLDVAERVLSGDLGLD
jgi:response regulator NasT